MPGSVRPPRAHLSQQKSSNASARAAGLGRFRASVPPKRESALLTASAGPGCPSLPACILPAAQLSAHPYRCSAACLDTCWSGGGPAESGQPAPTGGSAGGVSTKLGPSGGLGAEQKEDQKAHLPRLLHLRPPWQLSF